MKNCYLQIGKLIDGRNAVAQKDTSIRIVDGFIAGIGGMPEPGDTIVDYTANTVMPGIINCHVHVDFTAGPDPVGDMLSANGVELTLVTARNLAETLSSGITYVRNMGSKDFIDMQFKSAIGKGLVKGPGIVTCGHVISITGGHGYQFAYESDGPDECRKNTRRLLKTGVDQIKTISTGGIMTKGVEPGSAQMTYDELKAVVEEAKKAGRKVSSHAQGTEGIRNAVMAGVDSIEHAIYLTDEVIDLMLERGTYLVPTLVAPWFIIKNGEAAGIPKYVVNKAETAIEAHFNSIKKAYKAGVKIAMGTDSGTPYNPHGLAWEEFKLMTDIGMSPMETITAATKTASKLLGIDKEYGTLEVGKAADILVVDGDPIADLSVLSKAAAVWKGGVLVQPINHEIM